MKKIFYSLFALLALVATSCSNDEIEIVSQYKVTFNINTEGAYSDFGYMTMFTTELSQNNCNNAVYSYIYDSSGKLVASEKTYTKTITQVNHSFDLKEGTYTYINLEMLVKDDNKSDWWVIEGEDNLNTIRIMSKDGEAISSNIRGLIGYDSNVINVKNGANVDSRLKSLGTLLHIEVNRFENSSFEYVALLTRNEPIGRYLNPNMSGSKNIYDEYSEQNTWSRVQWFSTESSTWITYWLDDGEEDYTFGAFTGDDTSFYPRPTNGKVTFKGNGELYGGIWYTGEGVAMYEGFLGTKSEYDAWTKTLPAVNTKPLFDEPYTTWGASVRTVQNYMSSYTMTLGKSGSAVLQDDGTYALSYNGKGSVMEVDYFFTSSTNGLVNSDLWFDADMISLNQLRNYLSKYESFGEGDNYYMYASADFETLYILQVFSNGVYLISYYDSDYFLNSAPKVSLQFNEAEIKKLVELKKDKKPLINKHKSNNVKEVFYLEKPKGELANKNLMLIK